MDGRFENFRLALVVVVLLLVGFSGSVVFGGKDIELSEVPQVVRVTIERELKNAKIDDLERDKDNGKIVYDVKAETENNRNINLKVAADGTIIKEKRELKRENLPAVILNAVKKSVGDFDYDDIEKRFELGRRTIYRIKGDKGDMEIKFKIAEDGTILDKDTKHNDNDDLPDSFRDQRRLFLRMRGQLKIAALGDSRVEKGIDPKYFLGEKNRKYPMALNFGSGGSGLPLVQVIIEDYLVHTPKLQWVVYGISPRAFNKYYHSDTGEDIRKSRTYRLDKQEQGWPEINTEPVPASAIDGDDLSPWGFDGEDGMEDEIRSEKHRRDKQRDLRKGRYRLDMKRLEVFESLIQLLARQKIRMLAFTPPIHPLCIGQPCTDDDGTTRQGYDEFVKKMKVLDKKYPNFHFIDVDNKGEHKFEHNDFNNFDHLNKKGAKKLTLMLNDFIKGFDSDRKKKIGKEQP